MTTLTLNLQHTACDGDYGIVQVPESFLLGEMSVGVCSDGLYSVFPDLEGEPHVALYFSDSPHGLPDTLPYVEARFEDDYLTVNPSESTCEVFLVYRALRGQLRDHFGTVADLYIAADSEVL